MESGSSSPVGQAPDTRSSRRRRHAADHQIGDRNAQYLECSGSEQRRAHVLGRVGDRYGPMRLAIASSDPARLDRKLRMISSTARVRWLDASSSG